MIPVERRLSAAAVVAIWGIFNVALIAILIGFTAARSGTGSRHRPVLRRRDAGLRPGPAGLAGPAP